MFFGYNLSTRCLFLIQNKRKIKLGLILLSIILLMTIATTFIPVTRIEKSIDFSMINPELPDANLPADLPVYLSEEIQELKLITPQWLWRGEPQYIDLSIQPKADNPTLQKSAEGSPMKYHVYLEARLELGLVQMLTGDTVIEAVNANHSAQFLWQVKAVKRGKARGNLWIFVNITDSQSGNTWKLTRFALPLQMEGKDVIGLSLSSVRSLTLIGFFLVMAAGLVLIVFQP
jgi:hypothetical protein